MRTLAALAFTLMIIVAACSTSRTASQRILLDAHDASAPTAAVDPESGMVYWAWFGRDEAGTSAVYVSRTDDPSGTPSIPVTVSGHDEAVNPHPQAPPQIAVGPDGTVYVSWTTRIDIDGRRFPASNVLLVRSTDGGRSFSAPVYVNDDAGGPPAGHTFHNLAVGPDGTVYVSWLDSRDAGDGLSALREAGTASSEHSSHATKPSSHTHGGAAPAHTGNEHGGHDEFASNTFVRVARSIDGGRSFAPGVVVARGTCQCCRTALHVGKDGTVYVAWRHIYGSNTRDVAMARSKDGGHSFSAPVRVHVDGWAIDGCPHSGPSLTTDAAGKIHITWYTAASDRIGLYHAVSDDGGQTFGTPVPLERDVPIASSQLASSDGATWIVWENPKSHQIFAGTAEGSDRASFEGSDPAVAAGAGFHTLAWQHDGSVFAVVSRDVD